MKTLIRLPTKYCSYFIINKEFAENEASRNLFIIKLYTRLNTFILNNIQQMSENKFSSINSSDYINTKMFRFVRKCLPHHLNEIIKFVPQCRTGTLVEVK